MPVPSIRAARVEDAPTLRAILVDAVRADGPHGYGARHVAAWSRALDAAALGDRIRRADGFFVFEDGGVLGFGARVGAHVDLLYVHPEAMRRGVGRALLTALEQDARAAGIAAMDLNSSLNAVPFYEASGWRREGIETVTGPGGESFERVAMRRVLTAATPPPTPGPASPGPGPGA